MATTLKLGTRRSLLATAQSRLIATAIERLNPSVSVQLIGMETRGDQLVDVPLRELEGKDFFVTELDNALLAGDIDVTVHSLKDLSLDRPAAISQVAIPERANPRDVVLFEPNILDRLSTGLPVRLGTSSPRRIENVPPFLEKALPQVGPPAQIAAREIRGNVNTRISNLLLQDDDPQKIDAVVLAFAGLIRLWNDPDGQAELAQLLPGLRWMILPLAESPAAPAQGALAVECRADDATLRRMLEGLHDPATADAVNRERSLLADWGGGCHQTLGATVEERPGLGGLTYIRGRRADGELVSDVLWQGPETTPEPPAWDGTEWRGTAFATNYLDDLPGSYEAAESDALFVAHSRALPEKWGPGITAAGQRVWTAGTRSWFRLAARGIWVEGCAEESGFDALLPTLQQPLLGLPDIAAWQVLTHTDGADSWPCEHVTATYSVTAAAALDAEHPAVAALRMANSIFWASGSQYELFRDWVPDGAQHACRQGKTYNALLERLTDKNKLIAYPSVSHWRALTDKN